jgi:hypothetical protein
VVSQREVIFACEPSLIRDGLANRPASMSWNQLGRSVKRGEKGIAILAPLMGKPTISRQTDANEQERDTPKLVLLGFRRVHVWERLPRDLWPRLYALDGTRGPTLRAYLR